MAAPDPAPGDLRRYAALRLGMEIVVTSIPWYGRTQAQMRQIGARLTETILRVLD